MRGFGSIPSGTVRTGFPDDGVKGVEKGEKGGEGSWTLRDSWC